MRKIIKRIASIVAYVSLMSLTSLTTFAYGESPDFNKDSYNSSNIFASIGYYGQCTWYAYGRASEVNNKSYPFKWDAAKWYYFAQSSDEFEVGSEPRANSIAVWSYYNSGHVAYVEDYDGVNVTISEANNNHAIDYKSYSLSTGINQYDGIKTYTKEGMVTRYSKGTLLGYIYLGNIEETSSDVDLITNDDLPSLEDNNEQLKEDNKKKAKNESVIIYSKDGYYSQYSLSDDLIIQSKAVILELPQ
ncbi:CHAP domain-containing protein [Lachnospira multipara]|uniref:CHAP domain-containing protein n=1 Tax=Lachnospira multipara TaxID=28051 RepID=UPI0004E27B67|nr:CHAP domain-containing protein [Lachnospira multipara]